MSSGSALGGRAISPRLLAVIGLVAWAAVVGVLTLTPQPANTFDTRLARISFCLVCGERGAADAVLNVVLFMPLGLLLVSRGWSPLRAAVVALAVAAAIETTQHFIPGRYSNVGDVAWNTFGAWTGALLWWMRARWFCPFAPARARLGNAASLLPALVGVAFAWLMAPAWPAEPYWGQWTPDLASMERYDGHVTRADLDSILLPPRRFPADRHPRRILRGDWTIDATVVKGRTPRSLAPIVTIYDGRHREVTLLGAWQDDLVYRERSRARALRFDQPLLRLHGVMARVQPGDTIHLAVERQGSRRCLSLEGERECPGFTPGRAWAILIYVGGRREGMRRGADALWMVLLLLPVGLWSESVRGLIVRGLVAALALALAVALTRLAAPHWTEVAGAACGVVGGRALRALTLRLTRPGVLRPGPA